MRKIIQLEQHVANLIAAGEVVSRPASVVKELVENSIDAGAKNITVETVAGGMSSIRVADDGCGIEPEDLKTAFLRHATSKLHSKDDLGAIKTLGFRGEALAAIAAVSRVEVLTRTPLSNEGVRLTLEGGNPSEVSPAGCPVGTSIIVRNLFFNTPARQKFMKTDRAEGSAVSSVVLALALSRPDISFRYIRDGKPEYTSPGDCRADSCIYTLLGAQMQSELVSVSYNSGGVSVSGFVSSCDASYGNRRYQFFFLNGRFISSLLLRSALEQAYKNTLMTGRFPACFLYITTDVSSVDVNVHPAKTEVKFISDKQIFDSVYYAVLGTLDNKTQPPPATQNDIGFTFANTPVNYSANASKKSQQQLFVSDISPSYIPASNFTPVTEQVPATVRQSSADFRIIGEVLSTYIIIEYDDCVCFIDKHAAHERIHFDAYQSAEYTPMSEQLLVPVVCKIGSEDATLLTENAELLDALGFSVDCFGEDAVAVRCMPADIRQDDVLPVLTEICENLSRGGSLNHANLDKIHKALACKAAIKAGSISDIRELEALAARVMSGEISHCPHGRPVLFKLTKADLEKSFGRI